MLVPAIFGCFFERNSSNSHPRPLVIIIKLYATGLDASEPPRLRALTKINTVHRKTQRSTRNSNNSEEHQTTSNLTRHENNRAAEHKITEPIKENPQRTRANDNTATVQTARNNLKHLQHRHSSSNLLKHPPKLPTDSQAGSTRGSRNQRRVRRVETTRASMIKHRCTVVIGNRSQQSERLAGRSRSKEKVKKPRSMLMARISGVILLIKRYPAIRH